MGRCFSGFFRAGSEQGVIRMLGAAARLQEFGDEPRPAGLMRRADAAASVAMKIFMEQHVVLEVRVGGELGMIFQDGPLAVAIFEE